MQTHELRLVGIDTDEQLYAARWALFVFPEVRDLRRIGPAGRVEVIYDNEKPAIDEWLTALHQAGYSVPLAA